MQCNLGFSHQERSGENFNDRCTNLLDMYGRLTVSASSVDYGVMLLNHCLVIAIKIAVRLKHT